MHECIFVCILNSSDGWMDVLSQEGKMSFFQFCLFEAAIVTMCINLIFLFLAFSFVFSSFPCQTLFFSVIDDDV